MGVLSTAWFMMIGGRRPFGRQKVLLSGQKEIRRHDMQYKREAKVRLRSMSDNLYRACSH